jgi:hypothetical protein
MTFKKGDPRPANSGRKRGTPNRTTSDVRKFYSLVFDEVGGVDALIRWARKHPTRFYMLAARIIPKQMGKALAAAQEQL